MDGVDQEGKKFIVTSKHYSSNYIICLVAVFIGSFLGALTSGLLVSGIVFLIGLIIVSIIFFAFRKHVGDFVEITRDQISILQAGKRYDLELDQIISIIYKKYHASICYEILTREGEKLNINPRAYENGEGLEKTIQWFMEVNQIDTFRAINKLKL